MSRLDRLEAREKVIRCALEIISVERRLAEDDGAVAALDRAETELELASRDLVNMVDDLPPGEHPRGWAVTPDVIP